MKKTSKLKQNLLVCILLIVATFVVYGQVRNHEFIDYDDNTHVFENPHVREGLTPESIIWAFTATQGVLWHPLTWLSFMVDYELFGLNPGWYHLVNVLFHIANTLILFLFLRYITGALWRSAFVAALFALHPLHVESVAWVTERKDVLSIFFMMLAMWMYVKYAERPSVKKYFLILLFFVLGLMAKPMIVTFPFVLLLLDYWPLGRFKTGEGGRKSMTGEPLTHRYKRITNYQLIMEKIPFFALSAARSIFTFFEVEIGLTLYPVGSISMVHRITNAIVSYVVYIGKMFWPNRLAIFYPHKGANLPVWQVVFAGLFLIGVTVIVIRLARRFAYLPVGWFWYIGTLVPVIGLGEKAMADRYTYMTVIGLYVIIAWVVHDISARWGHRRMILILSAGIVLTSLAINSWLQVRLWKDSVTLFEHSLNVTEDNYVLHYGLGQTLRRQEKIDEAVIHYKEALRIHPEFYEPNDALGSILAQRGDLDQAIKYFREAVRINPYDPQVLSNLGLALGMQGRLDEAVSYYRKALKINPNLARTHYNLGYALNLQGKTGEAEIHFREATRLQQEMTR